MEGSGDCREELQTQTAGRLGICPTPRLRALFRIPTVGQEEGPCLLP